MSQTHFLTPGEYRLQVEQTAWQQDPREVVRVVDELVDLRHPSATAAGLYYLPVYALLSCYRDNQDRIGAALPQVLGPPQSEHYWPRLASFASYVYRQRHWQMLGKIAHRIDWSLAAGLADDGQPSDVDQHDDLASFDPSQGLEFCEKLQSVLDVSGGRIEPHEYLQVALGYFGTLPDRFAVPTDLAEYRIVEAPAEESGGGGTDWPMLRFFWTNRRDLWRQFPKSIESLTAFPNPFATLLAEQLRSHTEERVEDEVRLSETDMDDDPFQDLAGQYTVDFRPDVPPPDQSVVPPAETIEPVSLAQPSLFKKLWIRTTNWWQSLRNRSTDKVH